MMTRRIGYLAVALAAGISAVSAAAQNSETLKELLHFQQCPLAPLLRAVYTRPAKVDGRARFTTVTVMARPQSYVQCLFTDRASVYCEASAFSDGPIERKTPLTPDAVAALQRLGFAPQPNGYNLVYERASAGEPDFDAIAVLMLTALHDAYGVRADTALDTYAPFAGNIVTACLR